MQNEKNIEQLVSPVLISAMEAGYIDTIRYLNKIGRNVNLTDKRGML